MAQPDSRKYQLFPREHQSTASPVKHLAPEQAFAVAMGQNSDKADKFTAGGLRFRIKDHNLPVSARRRKVSVPELGPMTTVHESSMDSRKSSWKNCYPERHVHTYDADSRIKPPSQDVQYFMSAPPVHLAMLGNYQTTHPDHLRPIPNRTFPRALVLHCLPRIFRP